jgi:hypothetical protein
MMMPQLLRTLQDLLRGLFAFPDRPKGGGTTAAGAAAAIEARYSRPRRCC